MFTYDPAKRISASEALDHPWFKESPLPAETHQMPNFDPINEVSRSELRNNLKK